MIEQERREKADPGGRVQLRRDDWAALREVRRPEFFEVVAES